MKSLKSVLQSWQQSNLMLRILFGIIIGAVLAIFLPGVSIISMLGDLFVGALKGIAPILVAVLVASSIATARGGLDGRFRIVILRYMLTTLIAAVLAVFASMLFPTSIALANVEGVASSAPGKLSDIFGNIVKGVITNPITAIANANYLSILFWAVIVGLALKSVANETTISNLRQWANSISKVV
ncbi:MAG: cation:dicarboxylase symporter family transporter, partial [Alistipes sp.]|nr:cation:dicarboxylase symporter family transporter [Alistipes sp.]